MSTHDRSHILIAVQCPDAEYADGVATRLRGFGLHGQETILSLDGLGEIPADVGGDDLVDWLWERYDLDGDIIEATACGRSETPETLRYLITSAAGTGHGFVAALSRAFPEAYVFVNGVLRGGAVWHHAVRDGNVFMERRMDFSAARGHVAFDAVREQVMRTLRFYDAEEIAMVITAFLAEQADIDDARRAARVRAEEWEDWAVRATGPEDARGRFLDEARTLHEHPDEMVIDPADGGQVAWVIVRRRGEDEITIADRRDEVPRDARGMVSVGEIPPRVRHPFDIAEVSRRHPELTLTRYYVVEDFQSVSDVGYESYRDGERVDEKWQGVWSPMDEHEISAYMHPLSVDEARDFWRKAGLRVMRFIIAAPFGDYVEGDPT